MNLKPLGDRVIVKQDEAEETTASGLFLATEAKEKPQSGTVLAVGEGKLDKDGNLVPVPVKVGDKVVYLSLIHIWIPRLYRLMTECPHTY